MGKFRGLKPVFDDFGRFLGKSVVSEAHSVVSESHSMAADSHSMAAVSHSMAADSHSMAAVSHSMAADSHSVGLASRSVALETNSVTGESHWAVPQRHWMAANGDSPAAEDEFLKTRMGVKPFGRNVQPRTAANVLRAGDRPRSVSFGVPRLRGQGW